MVEINTTSVTIGGRSYNKDKSGYPTQPTVFSGVDITWGAGSCIEHPDPSRAQLSLWVPKTHETFLPALGEVVEVKAEIGPGGDLSTSYPVTVFAGKVEAVKVRDDHKETPTPEKTSMNLVKNPSFETGTTGVLRPSTVTVATTTSASAIYTGTQAMSATVGAGASTSTYVYQTVDATAGQWLSWAASVGWSAGSSKYYRMRIGWMDSSNAYIGSVISGPVYAATNATGGGVRNTYTAQAPTGTVTARLFLYFYDNSTGTVAPVDGSVYTTDGWMACLAPDQASAVAASSPYFDGDSADESTIVNQWNGTPHNSTSVQQIYASERATGGYRVNVIAADALAEAARLRLSDSMWPFEYALNRQQRIADLATKSGVTFNAGLTEAQGYFEAIGTKVRARDVDSFPALEAFQRTTMAAGHTVLSAGNVVQPSVALNLPQVLLANQPATGIVYDYYPNGAGQHVQITNGIVTRINWASGASADSATYFTVTPGTGGAGSVYVYTYDTRFGDKRVSAKWTASATGGTQGVSYQQAGITGASASKVSCGMWVRSGITRTVKLAVNLFSGATPAGSGLSPVFTLTANAWTYIKLDGVTATAAYDTVEVMVQAQTNMLVDHYFDIDGVLIEKTATGGGYFDRYTLDAAADVVASERIGIPAFDSSVIVDDVFELDTSNVVNEIKVEMKRFVGSTGAPGWEAGDDANQEFDQVFTDDEGSKKTTPQSRSIATDWAIQDAYMDDLLPSSTMVTKGRLLLAGQSKPQWRMSSGMTLVLTQVPTQEAIYSLLWESDRFGALVRIDNGPSFIPQYMRVRGGRIVLGEEPVMELDVEPVEYSAPLPLSRSTLQADDVASNYRITNFKTLTPNDLRTIGAR